MEEIVKISLSENVAVIAFDRPPNNFVDTALMGQLADALEALDQNANCRAVVLRSNGKVFCAGADISNELSKKEEPSAVPAGTNNAFYEQAVRLFLTRKPIIVAVQGAAVGAGLGLALVGDFRIAAEEARFAANFVKLGFHAGFAISDTLPRLIGTQAAATMLLTGRRIDAATALSLGLVDSVTTAERLYEEAFALAVEIAANAPLAVEATRATLRGDLAERVRARTAYEWVEQQRLMRTADFAEGVRAVTERRAGNFNGK